MFALIVVVHEWGHFIAARLFKVRVDEFAIGLGPKLYGKQKGETLYTIRALPLGGFCKMAGESDDSKDEDSMFAKKAWQKLIIFAAGAIMNFILAGLLFAIIVGCQGYQGNVIDTVQQGMPASEVGIVPGDRIIKIDGVAVEDLATIQELTEQKDKTYRFTVKSEAGTIREVQIKHQLTEEGRALFGFVTAKERTGIFRSIAEGFKMNLFYIEQTMGAFGQLITGKTAVSDMAGIVGVAQVTSDVWNQGMTVSPLVAILGMLNIAGILSVNLGVFNLLPIPALDGGRIFFSLIEMIRRKPIDPEKEGMVHTVGFLLLIILMVVVLYNDIVRLVG